MLATDRHAVCLKKQNMRIMFLCDNLMICGDTLNYHTKFYLYRNTGVFSYK